MPSVISDFKEKRVTDYIKPGDSVLIEFVHGIGDMIMFQPLYQRLKELYPDVEFHLQGNTDQQYFEDEPNRTQVSYHFKLHFPETTGNFVKNGYAMSKPEACAVLELGIPWTKDLEFTWDPELWNKDLKIDDNCIGVVFQVNSNASRSLDPITGTIIWNRVKEHGFRPIEVFFKDVHMRPRNGRFACVDYTCRDFEAIPENMIAVIKQCKGFIGVNTGTFCAATCLLHGHTLHLRKNDPFGPYYKRIDPVQECWAINAKDIDLKAIEDYLAECRSRCSASPTEQLSLAL